MSLSKPPNKLPIHPDRPKMRNTGSLIASLGSSFEKIVLAETNKVAFYTEQKPKNDIFLIIRGNGEH